MWSTRDDPVRYTLRRALTDVFLLLSTWVTTAWAWIEPIQSIKHPVWQLVAVASLLGFAFAFTVYLLRRRSTISSLPTGIKALGPNPSVRQICEYFTDVLRKHSGLVEGGPIAVVEIGTVRSDLDDETLRLYVFGHQNAGKSSLVNALLGGTYSPVGMGKSTTSLVRIRTAARPRTFVRWQNGIEEPTELARLPKQMTEWADAVVRPLEVVIDISEPILSLSNMELVDCPGTGSSANDRDNRSVEDGLVAQAVGLAAVAVVVYDYRSSQMESHDHLLRQLGNNKVPTVAVCNLEPRWASDFRVKRAEVEAIVANAEARLRTLAKAMCLRVAVEQRPEVMLRVHETNSTTLDALKDILRDKLIDRKEYVQQQAVRRMLGLVSELVIQARALIALNSPQFLQIDGELKEISSGLKTASAVLQSGQANDYSGMIVGAAVGGVAGVGGVVAAGAGAVTVAVTGGAVLAVVGALAAAGAAIGGIRDWRRRRGFRNDVSNAFSILSDACQKSTLVNRSLKRHLRSDPPPFLERQGHALLDEIQASVDKSLAQRPAYNAVIGCREFECLLVELEATLSPMRHRT